MVKNPAGVAKQYEDFDPSSRRRAEEDQYVIEVDVQGYKKTELHVKADKAKLVICGERKMDLSNKWQRFRKEYKVGRDWKQEEICSEISPTGTLSVKIPKKRRKTIKSLMDQSFPKLSSKLTKSYSRLKAIDGMFAMEVVALALLLTMLIIMVAFGIYVAQNCIHKPHN